MVALDKSTELRVPVGETTVEHLIHVVRNVEATQQHRDKKAYAGCWIQDGIACFDVSVHFDDRSDALEAAAHADQQAIYDLEMKCDIKIFREEELRAAVG